MRTRRLLALGAALTCAAATSVAVVRTRPAERPAALTVADPPSAPTLPPTDPVAPPTPTPPPAPAATPPPPVPSPPRPAPPVPEPTTPPAPPPPAPPLSTHWRAANGGASLDVRLDRATAPTAEVITFTVTADAGELFVNQLDVGWGDRTGHAVSDLPLNACGSASHQHRTLTTSTAHAYRQPGTYLVKLQLFAARADSCESGRHEVTEVAVTGTVTITPGAYPANGPLAPTVGHANQLDLAGRPDGKVDFQGSGRDRDGWVHELVVDWGDGSAPTVTRFPLAHCDESRTRWPRSDVATDVLLHEYPEPDREYVGRFRVVSTGCDGSDRQVAEVTFRVVSR